MDVFIEQIKSVRRTGKDNAKLILMAFGMFLVVVALLYILLFIPLFKPFVAALVFLALYFSMKILSVQGIEYEYIITNGILDIDKIKGKAKRERIASVNCAKIEAAGEYNQNTHISASFSKKFVCCNSDDKAYYIVANDKNHGKVCIVFAPNEKLSEALNKYLPRTIGYKLFKGE